MKALSLTVSQGWHVEDVSDAILATVGAATGALGLWLANRLLGKAAFQTAINHGFKELTDQLQEERRQLMGELSAERIASSAERSQLRGEVSELRQVIESLKSLLRHHGIEIPENLHKAGPEAVIQLPATDPL